MQHEATFISDDLRHEVGQKVSLLGIYDRGIVFNRLPARLLKLCVFQRWSNVTNLMKVTVELRGEVLAAISYRIEGKPAERESKDAHNTAQLLLAFGPVDFVRPGKLEVLTYFNEESSPRHTHELQVTVDPDLKLV